VSSLRAPHASTTKNKFDALYASLGMPIPAQTPASGVPEKTIAQEGREKNVKLLGDLPVSQFIPVMNYFAASMGRRCNYCHVNNNGQWDYASDAKNEKNRARDMIKLVLDTNKTLAQLKLDPVACYTCHRGRNSPQSVPPLPLPTPPAGGPGGAGPGGPGAGAAPGAQPQGSPTPRPTPTPAEELIQKYISAIGGQAAIDKIKSRTATGTFMTANGATGTYELMQSSDNGYEHFTTQRGTMERGIMGNIGWERNQQGLRELAGHDLDVLRSTALLSRNLSLKEQYTRLRTAGRDKVGDRDAYVVLAARNDTDAERLYFDVETGLLLRRMTFMRTIVGTIPEQIDFEDYRDVNGVKLPFTIRVSSVDAGNPYIVRKLTEIKLNAPVDDSKFKMPVATPPKNP
jgi:hypothetical protein